MGLGGGCPWGESHRIEGFEEEDKMEEEEGLWISHLGASDGGEEPIMTVTNPFMNGEWLIRTQITTGSKRPLP